MSERRYRLLIALLVLVALGALYAGIRATADPDDPVTGAQPDAIEGLTPGPGEEVVRQAELGADLATGYEGTLQVNGVEIPTEELRLVPEQNQVWFTPGEDKEVESLRAGPNCATVVAWRSAVGPDTAEDLSYTWCFDAL